MGGGGHFCYAMRECETCLWERGVARTWPGQHGIWGHTGRGHECRFCLFFLRVSAEARFLALSSCLGRSKEAPEMGVRCVR